MKITLDKPNSAPASATPGAPFEPAPHESIFETEIVKIEETQSFFKYDNSDDYKKEVTFTFKVLDEGDFNGRLFWGRTPKWFSNDPKCKLYRWVKSIYDVPLLGSDFELDTDVLVGMRCIIVVHAAEKKAREDGSHLNKDGSRKISNWVHDVVPSRAARNPPVSRSTPSVEELEPF